MRAVTQEMLGAELTDGLQVQKGDRTAACLGYRSGPTAIRL
ncbi:hypothetical protein [Microvirga sp. G4-2]